MDLLFVLLATAFMLVSAGLVCLFDKLRRAR